MNYIQKQRLKNLIFVAVFFVGIFVGVIWSNVWYFSTEQWRELDVTAIYILAGIVIGYFLNWIYKKIFSIPDKWVDNVEKYSKGIKGEEIVIQKLESILSDEYTIIPSVVVGKYGDADIVVVGPKGVLVIEVKNWSDPILIKDGEIWRQKNNGNLQSRVTSDPFNQVKGQAGSIRKFLLRNDLEYDNITPVLVFAGKNIKWNGKNPTLLCHVDNLQKALNYIENIDEDFVKYHDKIIKMLKQKSVT